MYDLFEKFKKDLKKGIEEGIIALKGGANAVSSKVDEIRDEAKRQYSIFDLKTKIQDQKTGLGDRVYDVYNSNKSIDEDNKVKALFVKIKKLEWQLAKIEGAQKAEAAQAAKPGAKAKKAAPKAPKKAAAKKTAPQAVRKTTRKATTKKAE